MNTLKKFQQLCSVLLMLLFLLLFCFQYNFCVFVQCILVILFIYLCLDSYPSINLSKHCGQKVQNFVTLLSCLAIGTAIKQCQENKKQVFISIGGATKGYVNNINDAERAKEFATRIWNLFLGGKATPSYRPFGEYELLFYFIYIYKFIIFYFIYIYI